MLQPVLNIVPPSAGVAHAGCREGLLMAQASPSKGSAFGTPGGTEEQRAGSRLALWHLSSAEQVAQI